jgi:hypothetical protein
MALLGAEANGETVRVLLGPPRPGAAISVPGAAALLRHLLRELVGEGVSVEAEGAGNGTP